MAQQLIALQAIVRYPGQIIWPENVMRMLEPTAQQGLYEGRTTRAVRITGLAQDAFEALPLRSLSSMAIQSRYQMDTTPPSKLFDPAEAEQALSRAREVLTMLKALDQDTAGSEN